MRNALFVFFCLWLAALPAQTSTFDTDNENWSATGDPSSQVPFWSATGGTPGGYIRVADAATGGTWYFVAPPKFLGNKCAAYGKYLRFDQFTSDTSNQQPFGGRPDVILSVSGGVQLIFDNANNPGLEWTHYDILLQEGAGWHFGSTAGPEPTEAEFRAALANVTGLQIRGEYRAQDDFGGLDNVILEGETSLDLDLDNSSGAANADFRADSLCMGESPICDVDVRVVSEKTIDSLTLDLLSPPDGLAENLIVVGSLPPNMTLVVWDNRLQLGNLGGVPPGDFARALQQIFHQNNAAQPSRGQRNVRVQIWTECGAAAAAFAYVPFFPSGFAGSDGDTTACADGQLIDLQTVLAGNPPTYGIWQPTLSGGGSLFDPASDAPGVYTYILYGVAGCPNDSARARVELVSPPELGPDTVACFGENLLLTVPPGQFTAWQWSTGQQSPAISVAEPGTYGLTVRAETCEFADTVRVDFFNCQPCQVFVPNIFRPDDDGRNDEFRAFASCLPAAFELQIFDRWGQLVFSGNDIEAGWDGKFRGKPAAPGVYFWRLGLTSDLRGQPERTTLRGDVTLLR